MSISTRLVRLGLAAVAAGLAGAVLGTLLDAVRGYPGWHITAASIGLHVGLLGEAWRLGLLGGQKQEV